MQNHGQLKEVLKIIYIFILTAVKNNMKKKRVNGIQSKL